MSDRTLTLDLDRAYSADDLTVLVRGLPHRLAHDLARALLANASAASNLLDEKPLHAIDNAERCSCGWAFPCGVVPFTFDKKISHQAFVALVCPECEDGHTFYTSEAAAGQASHDAKGRRG